MIRLPIVVRPPISTLSKNIRYLKIRCIVCRPEFKDHEKVMTMKNVDDS